MRLLYTILAFAGVLLAFCAGIFAMDRTNFRKFWPVVGCLALVQGALFFLLTPTGLIPWYLLPLAWLACFLPMALYSFVLSTPGLMGRKFTFLAGGMLSILPLELLSWVMALVFRFFFATPS